MAEVYRKRGRVVRFESGYLIRAAEAGESIEDGGSFTCAPLREVVSLPDIDAGAVEETAREIRSAVSHPLSIERLIVSEGVAQHEFGLEKWRESSRRIHLSLTYRDVRALIDLADFDLRDVHRIAELLPRAGAEREAPQCLRLAPSVTAALLPSLIGIAPPNVTIWQSAGGRDGKGQRVGEFRVVSAPWPNWFRPSYRVRPIRAPHNLRLECEVREVDANLPEAVALLAPVDDLTLRVLCADGSKVYPTVVRVARIEAVGAPTKWYPYAAGCFGAHLECGGHAAALKSGAMGTALQSVV